MTIEIRAFAPRDLPGLLTLCAAEGWRTWTEDAKRARRALTAPGVVALVAVEADEEVVGFAQLLGDGEITASLTTLAVSASHRRRGIARALIAEAARRAGVARIDLISEDDAVGFYASLPHRRRPGFRLYPEP